MCRELRILYPQCGHRDTALASCEFRDTGIRNIWGKRIPCPKALEVKLDWTRLCLSCIENQSPTSLSNADGIIGEPQHPINEVEASTSDAQSTPVEENDEIMQLLVRNEATLRQLRYRYNIPEHKITFEPRSPKDLSKQFLTNDEFLTRRAQGRAFRAHLQEIGSYERYQRYLEACDEHLRASQALRELIHEPDSTESSAPQSETLTQESEGHSQEPETDDEEFTQRDTESLVSQLISVIRDAPTASPDTEFTEHRMEKLVSQVISVIRNHTAIPEVAVSSPESPTSLVPLVYCPQSAGEFNFGFGSDTAASEGEPTERKIKPHVREFVFRPSDILGIFKDDTSSEPGNKWTDEL